MQMIYATVLRCDVCGVQDQVLPPPADRDIYPPVTPDGWITLGAFAIRRPDGSDAVRDLCPACKMKPFAEIWELGCR